MQLEKIELVGKKVFPIGLPSGIVATDPRCAKRLMDMCEEYGIWTGKSTSPYAKIVPEGDEVENPNPDIEYSCREPILAKLGPYRFLNAVGLTNPGAKVMREMIQKAGIPEDRVKIGSIFGKTLDDYIEAAVILEDIVDLLEGNYSCPNSEKEGMVFGQDPKTVYKFTKTIVDAVDIPFLAKLTPNMDNVPFCIGDIAKAAIDAGAYGIVLINTAGPNKNPYLYFGRGGESGAGISDLRIKCLKEVRKAIGPVPFIQSMGGIFSPKDAEKDFENGADAIAIGTALAGMRDNEIAGFLKSFVYDLRNKTDTASSYLKDVDMDYKPVKITEVINRQSDFKIFKTDTSIDALPGQFVFAMLPDIGDNNKPGEKPFSIMDDNPLTLGVLERGYFTSHFNKLREGDTFYYKGPHGQGIEIQIDKESKIFLIEGGCGLAGLYLPAKKFSEKGIDVTSFLGAKDKQHLPYLEEFEKLGCLEIATEDGSLGTKGTVADLIKGCVFNPDFNYYFFNCGPKAMVDAVLPLELKVTSPDRVYSSIDYMTRCGVGLCGSCADPKGRRTCVEGPFINQTTTTPTSPISS